MLDQIASHWHVTTIEVIGLLECQDTSALEKRTIFLVIDGLHSISDHFGQNVMRQILTQLGDLNQNCPGFIIACCTSVVVGLIDNFLASHRRRITLLCSPLEPPTINSGPVFKITDIVQDVLVSDCGGHGRALEMMVDVFRTFPAGIDPNVKSLVANRLIKLYSTKTMPEQESDHIAIIKTLMTNRRLQKYPVGTTTCFLDYSGM